MRCSTPECYMKGTWKVTHPKDPKLLNTVLVVCIGCAVTAGKMGADIHRIGGDKG